MENVFIMKHPLITHKISRLRDKTTGTNEFRGIGRRNRNADGI